ncbi:MAG: hypothetical protein R3A48_11515 [Polyangiales bacterium]
MRSVHSLDGKHFAFSDGFGLTRVSLPAKVKTERKITSGHDALLSADPTRTQLLAWRQNWDSMHHLSFPELKSLTKIDRFQLSQSVLADGGFVEIRSHYGSEAATTARRWSAPATSEAPVDIALLDAPTCEGLRVDGAVDGPAWAPLQSASSGVWAVLRGSPRTLYVGDFSERPVRLRWRAPVAFAAGDLVTLHPFDDGRVALCAFSPRRREATVARFSVSGRVEVMRTLPAVAPPALLSPDAALHQPDDARVLRTSLDDGSAVSFALPEAMQGPGRPFGEGAAMKFLPWDAEAVLDLGSGAALSRKLSDVDAPVRRFMRERVREINAFGYPGGLAIELKNLDVNPARKDYGFSWDSSLGDGSLHGYLAGGALSALTDDDVLRDLDGWRWSVGSRVSLSPPAKPWDLDEVDEALGVLEARGLPLLEALQCLPDAYDFWGNGPAPRRAAFTAEGARRFLSAMVFAMTARSAQGLRAAAREGHASVSAERVVEALRGLPQHRGPRVGYHVLDLLSAVAVNALGADALGVIAGLGAAPESWRNGLGTLLEGSLRWLLSSSPDRDAAVSRLRAATHVASVTLYLDRALYTLSATGG